jgi:hypothetical protein
MSCCVVRFHSRALIYIDVYACSPCPSMKVFFWPLVAVYCLFYSPSHKGSPQSLSCMRPLAHAQCAFCDKAALRILLAKLSHDVSLTI